MALALYRKYRPARFDEVVGQDHVTGPLIQAISSGRINHAYLFSGPRGCGKTSSARILARSLNCAQGPTATPCGVCDSCVALAPDGPGSLDVIEIDAASHNGVDDARDLRERAFYAPVSSRYKVYIIDEAHMVTTAAFNALLKVVEEPPEFVVFVFATTEPDKVLPTIRSRTHHYPFRLMPPTVMRGLLERICVQEGVLVEPTVLPVIVRAGAGSARDSLSLLDQLVAGADDGGVRYDRAVALLGVTDAALLDETMDALAAHDRAAVFQAVDRIVEAGHDPRRFAGDLLDRLRDLVVLDAVTDAADKGLIDEPADQVERMTDQAARLGTATLSRLADIVHIGLTEMRGTTSPRLLLELVCARMLLPAASTEDTALLQRLERLERRMEIGAAPATTAPPTGPAARPAASTAEASAPTPHAPADAAPPVRRGPADVEPPVSSRRADVTPAPATPTPHPATPTTTAPHPAAPTTTAPATSASNPEASHPAPPPASAAPSATPPAITEAPTELDAAAVRRVWQELLELVKRRRRATAALLMNATVVAVDGKILRLSIGSAPLMRLLSEEVNVEAVRLSLKDLLGVDWRIETTVEVAPAAGPRVEADPRDEEPDTTPAGPAGPRDHEADAISLLQSELGARTIDS